VDAPLLFSSIDTMARRLGARPPGQVRLTYLPCCGVVAWGRSQALIIGPPLLRVLTQVELRAVLARELAHLARRLGLGDEVAGPDQPAGHARPRASPLPDRLALIQAYAGPVCVNGDTQPATTFLGDLEIFEQMLHNRLFGLPSIEPTDLHAPGPERRSSRKQRKSLNTHRR